jgi:hypothetical protein
LQFALRRQIIGLRQLRGDFHPRVLLLFGHRSSQLWDLRVE